MRFAQNLSPRQRLIIAILAPLLGLSLIALAVAQYLYRDHIADREVTRAVCGVIGEAGKCHVGAISVGLWPGSDITVRNLKYALPQIQTVVTIGRMYLNPRSEEVDIAFEGGKIIRPGLERKLGDASANAIDGRISVASDGSVTRLEAFDIRMDGVGSLHLEGIFELPESPNQWASSLLHRFRLVIEDDGMMERQAEATRDMLATDGSLQDAYAQLYYQAEQGLGSNQDQWPINARLYLIALAAQAYPDIHRVTIELDPDQPLTMAELINGMVAGQPLPALSLEVPEPGAR